MNESFDEIENKVYHKGLNRWYQSIPFLWNYYDMGTPYEVYHEKKMSKQTFIDKYKKIMDHELIKLIEKYEDSNTDFAINCQYKNDQIWYTNKYNTDLYISFHTWLWQKGTLSSVIEGEKVNHRHKIHIGIYHNNLNKMCKGRIKTSYHYPYKLIEKKIKKNNKIENVALKIESGMSINKLCERSLSIHESSKIIKFSPHDSCNFQGEEKNLMFFSIIESEFGNCITLHMLRNVCDNNKNDTHNDFSSICDLQKI